MFLRVVALTVFGGSLLANAQQATSSVPEPEYRDQYMVLTGGGMVPLERETAMTDTQSRRHFVITPNTKVFESIPHTASPVRVGPGAHFYVKAVLADRDPTTVIHLHRLTVDKKDRRIPIVTYKQSLIPFGGVKHDRAEDDSVAFTVRKYGVGSLEIIPAAPLAPGEYGFVSGHDAQCFGVDPGLTAPTAAVTAPASAALVPTAPVWRLLPVSHNGPDEETHVAVLVGSVQAKGTREPSSFSLGCKVLHFSDGAPSVGSLPVGLKVRRDVITFGMDPFTCEGDGATGSPSVYTEIGGKTIEVRNACFDAELPSDPRAAVTLGLMYEDTLVRSIAEAKGGILTVRLRQQPTGEDDLVARFPLPESGSAVQAMLAPCLELQAAQHRQEQEAIVVSCPVVAGSTLREATVLIGGGLKKLATDPDNVIGAAWKLPKVSKAHPVRPKLTLACSYAGESGGKTEGKKIDIPAAAAFCSSAPDDYTNVIQAKCVRK